jgi:hypothetical protein
MRQAPAHWRGWARFCAWALVGAGLAISFVSFVGVLTILPVALVGFLLSRRSAVSPFGLSSGIGAMLLVVAYLQRQGPDTTCVRTATSVTCDQHLNPIPWLVAGLVFLTAGLVGYAWRSRER